jgi:hypothetical protein
VRGFKTLIRAGSDPFSGRNRSFETLHARCLRRFCRSVRSFLAPRLKAWSAQTRPRTESSRFAGRSNKCTLRAEWWSYVRSGRRLSMSPTSTARRPLSRPPRESCRSTPRRPRSSNLGAQFRLASSLPGPRGGRARRALGRLPHRPNRPAREPVGCVNSSGPSRALRAAVPGS